MNERITKLYSCCLDNRVVIIETNFKEFHRQLRNIEPSCRSDRWFSDKFKNESEFPLTIGNKEYFFQQLI